MSIKKPPCEINLFHFVTILSPFVPKVSEEFRFNPVSEYQHILPLAEPSEKLRYEQTPRPLKR